MRQTSRTPMNHGENAVKNIRRATRKQYSSERKFRNCVGLLQSREQAQIDQVTVSVACGGGFSLRKMLFIFAGFR